MAGTVDGVLDWPRRLIAWSEEEARLFDRLVAVVLGVLLVAAAAFFEPTGSERPTDVFAILLAIGSATTVVWRRTAPLVGLPLCVLFTLAYWVADYPGAVDLVLWMMFFAATRHGGPDRRRVWTVVGGSLLVVESVAVLGVLAPSEDLPFAALIGIVIIHGTAVLAGEALYQRSLYVQELEQRTAALEADLETKSALAAVEERTRIAREMHDIIAHGMSAIVVQAAAGRRVAESDPAKAGKVFEDIEGISRESINEMRRMLGVLRNDSERAVLQPQPTFDEVDTLIQRVNDTGVRTTLTTTGEPRTLLPGVELTAYRVIQEALTNVIRHAGRPVSADVCLAFTDDGLEVHVRDDGLGAAASAETAGTGHGLLGMRERVAIYNGSLNAGPRRGGGYEVIARLPVAAPSRRKVEA